MAEKHVEIFDYTGISGFERGEVSSVACAAIMRAAAASGFSCEITSKGKRPTEEHLRNALTQCDILIAHLQEPHLTICKTGPFSREFQVCIRVTNEHGFSKAHEHAFFGGERRLVLFVRRMDALQDEQTLKEVLSITPELGRALVEPDAEKLTPALRWVFGVPLPGEKWVLPLRLLCAGYLLVHATRVDEKGLLSVEHLDIPELQESDTDTLGTLRRHLLGEGTPDVGSLMSELWSTPSAATDLTDLEELLKQRKKQCEQLEYWRIWDTVIASELTESMQSVDPSGKAADLIKCIENGNLKEAELTRVVAEAFVSLSSIQCK